jgi:HK97 family phage major capsid protein
LYVPTRHDNPFATDPAEHPGGAELEKFIKPAERARCNADHRLVSRPLFCAVHGVGFVNHQPQEHVMIDTREMRENRRKLLVEYRTKLDGIDKEKREITAEERSACDKMWAAAEDLKTKIDDAENRNDLERAELEMASTEERRTETTNTQTMSRVFNPTLAAPEYRSMFDKWLTYQDRAMADVERRAQTAGTGTEGGFLYAPEQFMNELIRNVTDSVIVRQLARNFQLPTADSLGVPTLQTPLTDAEWTSELGVPDTGSVVFGKRALQPHPLAKEVEVSKVLIRKVPNAVGIVREELARCVAEANENAFMTGTGAQQPLGVFTLSNDGIPASRDVSTGNTATEVRFDGIKEALGELKAQYLTNAVGIFHRDVVTQMSKLKDGNGRYYMQDSVTAGEPDRICGVPFYRSEFAPNTMTASKYVGIFGDFSHYWIVDALDAQISRAEELYIRTNKDLFIIRMETDGAPVKSEAFVRVKLGT